MEYLATSEIALETLPLFCTIHLYEAAFSGLTIINQNPDSF